MSAFVGGTLQKALDSEDEDSDIQEIDKDQHPEKNAMAKPDSTSPKGLMKGTKESTFSEYADLVPSGQVLRTNR